MSQAQEFLNWLYGPEVGGSAARPYAVVEWAEAIEDDDGTLFWEVVTNAWSSFDLIPHDDFQRLFARFAVSVPKCELPDQITVYRGQDASAPLGLSWTSDRKVAEEFARGHRGMRYRQPVVLERVVTRDQVAFVCHDREENEVVLLAVPD